MTEQERIEAMASKMVFWSCAAAMAPEAMLESCAAQNLKKLMDDIEQLRADHPAPAFQSCVQKWMMACFGSEISADRQERNHRFLEESLELVQANGCTASEAHQLVDYVYGRPVGESRQEVGGVMVTLAALCLAHGMDMDQCGETELARVWTKIDTIRAKQAGKPKHSPLPELPTPAPAQGEAAAAEPALPSWTCFHCGETFTSELDARNHFGSHEGRMTACEIREAGEFAILRALRNVEDQLDRYRAEDSDVLRAMASMQADHAQALRREEEIGYERGLRDAKLPVDLVTPPPARASASSSICTRTNSSPS